MTQNGLLFHCVLPREEQGDTIFKIFYLFVNVFFESRE